MKKFRVPPSVHNVPPGEGLKLEEFSENDKTENWPFREIIGSLMWLAISTLPGIYNAVRAVARYCSAPKAIHWKAALGILAYINGTPGFGTAFQRGR